MFPDTKKPEKPIPFDEALKRLVNAPAKGKGAPPKPKKAKRKTPKK